jgi:hypothetical protein
MFGASRPLPHRWVLHALLAAALPAFACTPPQATDRSLSSPNPIGVGGAMRAGNTPSGPPATTGGGAADPVKTPTSVDPITSGTGSPAASDGGASAPGDPVTPGSADGGADPIPTPIPGNDAGTSPSPLPGPTDDGGAPSGPDPGLSHQTADSCKGQPTWVADSGPYLGGEKVTYGTPLRKFECRPWPYAPWCAQLEYEPGKASTPWVDAWIDRGLCP